MARSGGIEPPDSKRRPVVILTRDEAIGRVLDVIAVPATGTIRRLSTEVQIGVAEGSVGPPTALSPR